MAEFSIYIIHQRDAGFLKVGIAKDAQQRLKQLQVGNPFPLTLPYVAPIEMAIDRTIKPAVHSPAIDQGLANV